MISSIMLAQAAASQTLPARVAVASHDFECEMQIAGDKPIKLAGKTRSSEFVNKRGALLVDFHSTDKKWSFLSGSADAGFTPGPLYVKVVSFLDDRKGDATEKKYTLEMTFPSQPAEFRGAYGFAVLRNEKDDTPLVLENRPRPIVAIGPCNVTPSAKAPQ